MNYCTCHPSCKPIAGLDAASKQVAYVQVDKQLPAEDVAAIKAFLTSLSDKSRRAAR